MVIRKVGNIEINISFDENSWHEVNQINIVFGARIMIIWNHSYMQGFNGRVEQTEISEIDKDTELNPCVLCSDVYDQLKEMNAAELSIENISKIIKDNNIS